MGIAAGLACAEPDSTAKPWILRSVLGSEHRQGCSGHQPGERWSVACNSCFCNREVKTVCTRLDCNGAEGSALGALE